MSQNILFISFSAGSAQKQLKFFIFTINVFIFYHSLHVSILLSPFAFWPKHMTGHSALFLYPHLSSLLSLFSLISPISYVNRSDPIIPPSASSPVIYSGRISNGPNSMQSSLRMHIPRTCTNHHFHDIFYFSFL